MRQVSSATIINANDKHETDQGNVQDPTMRAWPGSLARYHDHLAPPPPYFFCILCINHTPMSPATKTVKAHVCSANNPAALPRRLRIAATTLPMIAGNASMAFPPSLSSVFANLSNHFFRIPLSFGRKLPASLPPPKSPTIESIIVAIPAKRAERVEIIITICSRIKIRILSGKGVFLSRTFSRVS